MTSDLKSHLSAKSTWIRLLYMILFVVAFKVAELVTWLVVAVQFLFTLFTGQANERLQGFGHTLAVYFRQTVAFLTYDSEDMPFPFAPWPEGPAESARPAARPAPEPPAVEPHAAESAHEPPAAEPASEPPAAAKPAARPRPKAKSAKPKRARKKPPTDDETES